MDAFAAYMEYHIVMAPPNIRPVTPHALIADVMGDRFDQGPDYTNWRPAGSGDWLLIHTTGGAGRLAAQASGHCYDVNPGDVILYSPGDPQDYATAPSPGRWQLQWAHFHPRPEWRAWLHWPEILPGVGHRRITAPETAAALTAALDRMIAHRRQPWEGARDLAMNALEEALLWIETTARADAHWQLDPRVRRALDYLAAHPAAPFHLPALAAHCALSPSRLGHLFTAATGLSPQHYAEELKLREAAQLLTHTGLNVAEVAAATSFADPLYFSKRFRRHFGHPPSRHAKQ